MHAQGHAVHAHVCLCTCVHMCARVGVHVWVCAHLVCVCVCACVSASHARARVCVCTYVRVCVCVRVYRTLAKRFTAFSRSSGETSSVPLALLCVCVCMCIHACAHDPGQRALARVYTFLFTMYVLTFANRLTAFSKSSGETSSVPLALLNRQYTSVSGMRPPARCKGPVSSQSDS